MLGWQRGEETGRVVRGACPLGRWGADAWAGVPLECGAAGSVGGRWREHVLSGADVLASGARRQREGKRARGRARRGASARGLCGTLGCSGAGPCGTREGAGRRVGASPGRGEVGCAEEEKGWGGSWAAWAEVVGRTGFWIF